MFENDGTTPEFQGNPESGIDQFLNQSNTTEPTIEELKAKVAELETKLAEMTASKESWYENWSGLKASIRKAEEGFRDILGGDMDATEIIESYGAVFAEHLGWEFTREFEIELTVTYRGTIELPFGKDVDDIDASDFSVESYIGHDSYNADLTHWNSEVEER